MSNLQAWLNGADINTDNLGTINTPARLLGRVATYGNLRVLIGFGQLAQCCSSRVKGSGFGRTKVDSPDPSSATAIQNPFDRLVSSHRGDEQPVVLHHDAEVVLKVWRAVTSVPGTQYLEISLHAQQREYSGVRVLPRRSVSLCEMVSKDSVHARQFKTPRLVIWQPVC